MPYTTDDAGFGGLDITYEDEPMTPVGPLCEYWDGEDGFPICGHASCYTIIGEWS
jgi:hypothetical protein